MIELAAALGAIVLPCAIIAGCAVNNDVESMPYVLGIGPIVGALWGATVGALIHFTFNGYLPGLVMSFFS